MRSVVIQSFRMEDVKSEVSQVLRNQMEINGNNKKFDKTNIFVGRNSQVELVANSESGESEFDDDGDSDIISEHIGHIGIWQLFWAVILCLFQFPTTFHIFCLVFQVSAAFESEINGLVVHLRFHSLKNICLSYTIAAILIKHLSERKKYTS